MLRVTISIGAFAFCDNNTRDHRSFLKKVDQALYLAKRSGKNRVCVFEEKAKATV